MLNFIDNLISKAIDIFGISKNSGDAPPRPRFYILPITIIGIIIFMAMIANNAPDNMQSVAIAKMNPEQDPAQENAKKIMLAGLKTEKVAKDVFLTDADFLYVSVKNDGTSRNGLAEYFCQQANDLGYMPFFVRIVAAGTSNNPNSDNAYGITLGECNCKAMNNP